MNTELSTVVVDGVQTIRVPAELPKYTPIVGTSRQGDFVHAGQKMSGDVGFRNVSRLWFDKCITIETGLERMAEQRKNREDIIIPAGQVEFKSDDKGLIVVVGGRDFRPSEHASRQLCTWYPTPSTNVTYYMNPPSNGKYERDEMDYDCVAYLLENGRRRIDGDKPLLFRTYSDGTLRGVMSDSYSIVDNEWYLLCLKTMIPGAYLSHWKGDADTIYGNILIPDTIRAESDSEYGGMLSISNSEIGCRTISQLPSVFRAICMNGNIWGSEKGQKYSQRHKGVDCLDDLADEIRENLNKQIPLLTGGVDLLLTTRKWQIETRMVNIFAQIGKAASLPASVMNAVCIEYKNQGQDQTAFGCIDAITRVSQLQDNATWVTMDTIAGQLVQPRIWANVQTVAKTLSDKEVVKQIAG